MQRETSDPRVLKMYHGDRRWAVFSLIALWATVFFVYYALAPIAMKDHGVLLVLAISAGLVLLFNTISIIVMLRHYSEDKDYIYGLDLYYLEAAASARL